MMTWATPRTRRTRFQKVSICFLFCLVICATAAHTPLRSTDRAAGGRNGRVMGCPSTPRSSGEASGIDWFGHMCHCSSHIPSGAEQTRPGLFVDPSFASVGWRARRSVFFSPMMSRWGHHGPWRAEPSRSAPGTKNRPGPRRPRARPTALRAVGFSPQLSVFAIFSNRPSISARSKAGPGAWGPLSASLKKPPEV